MALFDDNLFDGSGAPIVAFPAGSPAGYLGRFQLGQLVPLAVVPVDSGGYPAAPDLAPTATITAPDTTVIATVKLAMDGGPTRFALRFPLAFQAGLGTYQVAYSFVVAGVPGTASGSWDLVGGGDPGGRVISMCAYDRPEGRYVVAQLSAGLIVQGRNPRLQG